MDSKIVKNGNDLLTADERKVYDRQIRLWGHLGQNKYVYTMLLIVIIYLI